MSGNVKDRDGVGEEAESAGPEEKVTFPRFSLQDTLVVARAIEDFNAGRPFDRLSLAKAINRSPNSSDFRYLIISSGQYGLTQGGKSAPKIALTPLGTSIVEPKEDGEVERSLREALLRPELFARVLQHFDTKRIPPEDMFKNTLRREFGVAPERVDRCYKVLLANIRDFSLVENIKGTDYLKLDNLATSTAVILGPTRAETGGEGGDDEALKVAREVPAAASGLHHPPPPGPKRELLIAHGKNRTPLIQLKAVLDQFNVPHKVAIDEAHGGRAISAKVAETMSECGSGIFIFTADEETIDAQGNKVLRPSDNVVFELGAGTILYGKKIVIMREEGVTFGSDFTDYGHITFEKDRLDAKAVDVIKELIHFGLLQLSPT